MSNYDDPWADEISLMYDDWDEDEVEEREAPCPAHCRNGLVEVHGQETDCITCEGYGTILIPA